MIYELGTQSASLARDYTKETPRTRSFCFRSFYRRLAQILIPQIPQISAKSRGLEFRENLRSENLRESAVNISELNAFALVLI
jgi:hypothetical protein